MNTLQTPLRTLVVDDDASWLAILTEILTDLGLQVDQATSLDEAIREIKTAPHRLAVIDLALSGRDHHNRDGLRILEAARLHDPGCHTILLTGYATVELAVSVLTDYNAFTCLRKENFQRTNFRKLVNDVLAASPSQSAPAPHTPPTPIDLHSVHANKTHQRQHTRTAILVDDDAGWREIISELLVESGYSVRPCSSFGEAIGYLGRERYNLAIIDLSLKGQSMNNHPLSSSRPLIGAIEKELEGYRLLENTRAAGLPTIVVSGVASPSEIEYAYQKYNVFTCIEKQSFDRKIFLQALVELQTADPIAGEIQNLTIRERQVLELLVKGMTNKEIADSLIITPNTVKRHMKAVFEKLDVHTRSAAVAKAIKLGL